MITENAVASAINYAKLGWTAFPIQPASNSGGCSCRKGTDCRDAGKHPFHSLGGLKVASSDPEKVEEVFSKGESSIGLLCRESFWVLDVDGPSGLEDLDRLVSENGPLPATPLAETGGGGRHYLFKYDSRIRTNATKLRGTSIDVRSGNGAIVAPPSLHASGKRYAWLNDPETTPLSDAPEWLIAWVIGKESESSTFTLKETDLAVAPGAGEGERNSELCRLVGSHLAKYGETPDLLRLAIDWGSRCDPPLSRSEIERTVLNLVAKHLSNNPEKIEDDPLELEVLSFREIEAKPVAWLWPGRFAFGKLTLLTGDGGTGKSMLTCDLAARISRGDVLPDGASCPVGDSFFIAGEDGASDTIRPRLDAAGANVDRIHLIRGPKRPGEEYASAVDLSRHITKLDRLLSRFSSARMIVIDPVLDYLGEGTNSDRATDVRRVLAPLRSLAERHGVAIIAMNHLRKSVGHAKSRSLGSGAFVHVARIELRVCEDPEDPERRLLLPVKNNLASAPGLAYRIESAENGAGVCRWEEGTVDLSISEVEEGNIEDRSQIDEAIDWLSNFLSEGPVKASEAKSQSRKDGISEITLKRAKKKLQVVAEQKDRCWWWRLATVPDNQVLQISTDEAPEKSDSRFLF